MRVLVCGGLDYADRAELFVELDRLHAEYVFETVIAGGAGGVDALAVEWAQAHGIATQVFKAAAWGTLRHTAGQLRNARMPGGKPTRYRGCFSRRSQDGKHGEASEGGRSLGSDCRIIQLCLSRTGWGHNSGTRCRSAGKAL
jgi:hypothetical protein